ncbi:MAG: MoaD/ThiS family protein [Gammaproteobacteria bacterium]
MQITLKLYASLARYLPPVAIRNVVEIEIPDGASVHDVLDSYHVPRGEAHLILINGLYVEPEHRDEAIFRAGDVLAMWPPVAGG